MMQPDRLLTILREKGCVRMLAKPLAPNDNSKNQVYLGKGYGTVQLLPFGNLTSDTSSVGGGRRERLKASTSVRWITEQGTEHIAPTANLILYPDYPEVRFSGFLRGMDLREPNAIMTTRDPGRWLFLGIHTAGYILAYVCNADSPCAIWAEGLRRTQPMVGVFYHHLLRQDASGAIKDQLRRIAGLGWINSKRLDGSGAVYPCEAENCGGYTLEAELGITPNGFADPDFEGWEVKQFGVANLARPVGGAVTLFTPEPNGGDYVDLGVHGFLQRYGYPDRNGVPDRINFGGAHKLNQRHHLTGLTLRLTGWDSVTQQITSVQGGVGLYADNGRVAANWSYVSLIEHWKKKHAQAVYVPSQRRLHPRQYRYGDKVFAGTGADFSLVLRAFESGDVIYDPGVKMEGATTDRPRFKRRSQFRIRFRQMAKLYEHTEWWSL